MRNFLLDSSLTTRTSINDALTFRKFVKHIRGIEKMPLPLLNLYRMRLLLTLIGGVGLTAWAANNIIPRAELEGTVEPTSWSNSKPTSDSVTKNVSGKK